jgi:hypothetical protein
MIHREYVCKLAPGIQGFPYLDIVVSLPGTPIAPVGVQASYPGGPALTPAPDGWAAAGTLNWYYELRGRALRLPNAVGSAAPVPRTRLGGYLAIVGLEDSVNGGAAACTLPKVAISASLAPNPITNPLLGNEIAAFADPAYGPVIRLLNSTLLFTEERATAAYFLVSLGLAENKDEDWTNLGHA